MEKIMQKTLTPQRQSEDDQFAHIAEDTDEFDKLLLSCPSEEDRFATCSLLTILIFWEATKKNCNNSLKGWMKQLLDTV